MNVIYKLTLRHMRLNKRRTFVSIMGIVLAVALMTMLPTAYYSLMDFEGREAMKRSGYYHVKLDNYLYGDNDKVLDELDVKDYTITKNIGDYSFLEDEEGNMQVEPYTSTGEAMDVIRLEAVQDDFYKILPYTLIEGRYPESDREIVVDMSDQYWNVEPGDKLTIDGIQYTVSGTLRMEDGEKFEEDVIVSPDSVVQALSHVSKIFTRLSDEALNSETLVNGYLTVDNPGAEIEDKVNKLIEKLEKTQVNEPTAWYYDGVKAVYNYIVLKYYGMSKDFNTNAVFNSMLAIIEIVIAGVAVSVIANGFMISLSERSQYLGMLSSVGATKKQKRGSVYFEGFITAIIAIPLGIIIGIGATIPLFNMIEEPLMRVEGTKEPLKIVFESKIILWAVGFSLVTMIAALHAPAKRASRLTPVEAIRMNKDIKIPNKAVKPKKITRKLLGFEGELALKNLKRDNKKYIITAASMAVSMILFMTIYSVIYYTSKEYEFETDTEYYDYDMELCYTENVDDPLGGGFDEISDKVIATGSLQEYYRYSKLEIGKFEGKILPWEKILNTDDIYYSEEFRTYMDEAYEEYEEYEEYARPSLLVMNEEDLKYYLQSVEIDYEEFVSDKDNVILFDEFTEDVYFSENEQVTGHVYNEELKNIDYQLVKSEFKEYVDEKGEERLERVEIEHTDIKFNVYSSEKKIWGMWPGSQLYILLTPQKAEEVIRAGLNMYEYCGYYKTFVFNTAKHREISGLINDEIQSREGTEPSYYFEDNTKDTEDGKDMLYIASVCVYSIILVIALICVVNIINTLSTSMALRRREFAMLKAVGMSEKTFRRMIIYESMFYGVKTLAYGIPISTVFVWFTRYPYEEIQEKKLALPWSGYAISILGVFIIIGVTMLYSTSKIRKENLIDSLKDENT